MARKQAEKIDNKFIRGLITETTALNFPKDACTETWNCVFDDSGRITRRLGFDFETTPTAVTIVTEPDDAWSEYVWETSEGVELKTFLIVHTGYYLDFYDCSSSTNVGTNRESTYAIDLRNYRPTINYYDPAKYPCQFAEGNNQLIVVNKGIDPLLITYNPDSDVVEAERITIKYRDFEGLDDGLELYERPTESVASLRTNNPEHFYNLLNQGWHTGDALTQWDTALATMPSNADQVGFYRSSGVDAFDATRVTAYSGVLSTAAPKGHFILELGNVSRTTAMSDQGFTGAVIADEASLISAATGSVITNFTSNSANAFDSTTSQAAANCASISFTYGGFPDTFKSTSPYIGKDYSGSPQRIGYAKVYGSNDQGFVDTFTNSVLIRMYAKNGSAPSNALDGTLLGQSSVTSDSSSAIITIGSNDNVTTWDYVWCVVYFTGGGGVRTVRVAEVQFFSATNSTISFHRPQTVSFYQGRAWYSGVEDGNLNNNIYFSRIVLRNEDYGKCYQANDPTSEFISDLFSDDGGVIRLLEAGRIIKLFPYQDSMLVFCTNGVWRIQFSSATSISVRKISSVGTDSPASLVDTRGVPVWWGENGIYTVQYEANFNAFNVVSLTDETIKSFILDIPIYNRKFVKGAFDAENEIIYWLYNHNTLTVSRDEYKYTRVLCLNSNTKAFYPWSVSSAGPFIRGVVFLKDANRTVAPVMKYITPVNTSDISMQLYFSEFRNTTLLDWDTYGEDDEYESYFITGYAIDGEAQRYSQNNYIFVYTDTGVDYSCFIQGLHDFTTSASSNRWSNAQRIYTSGLGYKSTQVKRLKIRGKGRAIQLKFYSEGTKQFSIIGWSTNISQNAGV